MKCTKLEAGLDKSLYYKLGQCGATLVLLSTSPGLLWWAGSFLIPVFTEPSDSVLRFLVLTKLWKHSREALQWTFSIDNHQLLVKIHYENYIPFISLNVYKPITFHNSIQRLATFNSPWSCLPFLKEHLKRRENSITNFGLLINIVLFNHSCFALSLCSPRCFAYQRWQPL